jgi:hypothetical protein
LLFKFGLLLSQSFKLSSPRHFPFNSPCQQVSVS